MKSYEKVLLASVGLVGASAKGAKRLLGAISAKIPREEAKKVFAALVAEGESSKRASVRELKVLLKKVLCELDVPTRSEFAALKKKVDMLTK